MKKKKDTNYTCTTRQIPDHWTIRKVPISFLKGYSCNLNEETEKRARRRQASLESNRRARRHEACTGNESTASGRQQKPREPAPLTSTGPGLSASTSPWAASLHRSGDSITSSFLTLRFSTSLLRSCSLYANILSALQAGD